MKYRSIIFYFLLSILFITGCTTSFNTDKEEEAAKRKARVKLLKEILRKHKVNPVFTTLLRENSLRESSEINLIEGVEPIEKNGLIKAVIEIPAGSLEKWEVTKDGRAMEWEFKNGIPRIVNYIGYPGNYGFIPRSLLPKTKGGDGDPLDIIVLGKAIPRGEIVKIKLIGMLKFLDNGEKDDKLIGLHNSSPFYSMNNIDELKEKFPGVLEILKIWFRDYKGPGKMEFKGLGNLQEAEYVLHFAVESFRQELKR